MDSVSWVGVLLGAVTLFILGALWYTVLFGKAFAAELGVAGPGDDGAEAPPVSALAGQFVAGLVISFGLAWLISEVTSGSATVAEGAGVGLVGGALIAAALGQFYIFEGKTLKLLAINGGYILVGLTLVGVVLGALQ